ncbi:MAG: tetratricopeptide (TPR) repeat protein [Candidatus Azotimanducaceae bacterium]|jgi:tetratricopeptide (TPR) repeat protein
MGIKTVNQKEFMSRKIVLLGLVFLSVCNTLIAQKTKRYDGENALFVEAMALYDKQQYVAAQHAFEIVYKSTDKESQVHMDAEYFTALCAINLFHPDAGFLVGDFESNHPTSSHVNEGRYLMAVSLFDRKQYKNAIDWFEKVDERKLRRDDRNELNFKKGYSFFVRNDNDLAIAAFSKVEARTQYEGPAAFYHGHVAYRSNRNAEALEQFSRLKNDDSFGPIVPFYIAQIYYRQKQYEKVIKIAPELLDQASAKRAPELAHIIADSYYQIGDYKGSLPYYKLFTEKGGRLKSQEYYQIGFANHKTGNYGDALDALNKIVDGRDSLAQQGYYILADCYLKTGDKQAAKNAFKFAADMPFDAEIIEDSQFNYAKLVYELEDAFADPGKVLEDFMEAYPNSKRADELYDLLVNYFLTTKDYKKALDYFDVKGVKSIEAKKAYQKIAYYRGVQLFNRLNWSGAIEYLNKSLLHKYNNTITAKSYYWKAESQFRDFDYSDALSNYRKFKQTAGSYKLIENRDLEYNMAYAYFKLKDYRNAVGAFRSYLREATVGSKSQHDAFMRAADCYFVLTDYNGAIDFYQKALQDQFKDNDYTLLQMSLCFGLVGKQQDRISTLNNLISNYPTSLYIDDAIFELGNGYMIVADYVNAIPQFDKLIVDYPNSSYVPQSMLKSGLANYNQGNFPASVAAYKKVTQVYPNTREAQQAIVNARNVYVSMEDVSAYATWVKTLPFANVSNSSLDSTAYEAAEIPYISGNCDRAITSFSNYLTEYDNGYFALNAHYYRGQCLFKNEKYKEALLDYAFVIEQQRNTFSEVALLRASEISYYLNNYPAALDYFLTLEQMAELPANRATARKGIMRCYNYLKKYPEALGYANLVLMDEKLDPEERQEAHVIKARGSYKLEDFKTALVEYKLTVNMADNALKAEALYHIAEMEYRKGLYEKAKEGAFALIEKMPDFPVWKAKSLILLSRCYWKLEDVFNANYILDQLISNSNDTEIIEEAQALKALIAEEEQRKVEAAKDTIVEVEINDENTKDDETK